MKNQVNLSTGLVLMATELWHDGVSNGSDLYAALPGKSTELPAEKTIKTLAHVLHVVTGKRGQHQQRRVTTEGKNSGPMARRWGGLILRRWRELENARKRAESQPSEIVRPERNLPVTLAAEPDPELKSLALEQIVEHVRKQRDEALKALEVWEEMLANFERGMALLRGQRR